MRLIFSSRSNIVQYTRQFLSDGCLLKNKRNSIAICFWGMGRIRDWRELGRKERAPIPVLAEVRQDNVPTRPFPKPWTFLWSQQPSSSTSQFQTPVPCLNDMTQESRNRRTILDFRSIYHVSKLYDVLYGKYRQKYTSRALERKLCEYYSIYANQFSWKNTHRAHFEVC